MTIFSTQEERINALEAQLQALLQWQQSFSSTTFVTIQPGKESLHVKSSLKRVVFQNKEDGSVVSTKEVLTTPPDSPPLSTLPTTVQDVPPAELEALDLPPLPASPTIVQDIAEVESTPTATNIAETVLKVLQRYGKHLNESIASTGEEWVGKTKFLPHVQGFIERGEPVKMILPAFPWKSVSQSPGTADSNFADIHRRSIESRKSLGLFQTLARISLCLDLTHYVWTSKMSIQVERNSL